MSFLGAPIGSCVHPCECLRSQGVILTLVTRPRSSSRTCRERQTGASSSSRRHSFARLNTQLLQTANHPSRSLTTFDSVSSRSMPLWTSSGCLRVIDLCSYADRRSLAAASSFPSSWTSAPRCSYSTSWSCSAERCYPREWSDASLPAEAYLTCS